VNLEITPCKRIDSIPKRAVYLCQIGQKKYLRCLNWPRGQLILYVKMLMLGCDFHMQRTQREDYIGRLAPRLERAGQVYFVSSHQFCEKTRFFSLFLTFVAAVYFKWEMKMYPWCACNESSMCPQCILLRFLRVFFWWILTVEYSFMQSWSSVNLWSIELVNLWNCTLISAK
jgi:hypothetical protein